jgi:phage tail sheath gpL-like
MKLFLQARWHALVMNEGLAFTAARGSISDLMDLGDAPNDQTLTIMETSTSPTPPYIWAAQYAAVAAFEPIPNRPLWTLALPGVLPPVLADRRTLPQTNQLLNHGISCHFVDEGGVVRIRRAITTYRVNEWDVPDRSFLDLEKMNLLAELRYLRRVRIAQKFPRCRLTSNTSRQVPGDVVTPDDIRHDFFAQALDWIRLGYIRDDMPALKAAYLCEIDPDDPHRVNELIQPNLVVGLAVYAGLLQFLN